MTVDELRRRLESIDGDRTVKISVDDHGVLMVYDLSNVGDGGNGPAHSIAWLVAR